MNGVEGSLVDSTITAFPQEILRLRKTPLSLRLAPLRMTVQIMPINPSSEFDDDALEAARRELNAGVSDEDVRPTAFVYACPLSAIPVDGRRGRAIPFDDEEVALFNLNG